MYYNKTVVQRAKIFQAKKNENSEPRNTNIALYKKCLKKQHNTILLQELTSEDSDH